MLKLESLEAFYGPAQVLFGLDIEVNQGDLVALVGRNGAGKSTAMKTILALGPQANGRILFEERNILGLATHEIASLGIGYVPEERRIFADLTVRENLVAGERQAPPGHKPWSMPRLLELFPPLSGLLDRRAGLLSGGEQQMLAVARTLMGNPRLLLLDEPSEGLAPIIVRQLSEAVAELKREGIAILLSEQNLHFAERLCDRAYVLEKGRVLAEGPLQRLLAEPAISRALAL